MDLEKLRVFYHVAKSGSMTKSSIDLNIAQSALSRSISILEHILKTTLLVRHRRGVTLTREGEIWFKHVKKAMAELETAKLLVAADDKKVRGELKISTSCGFTSLVLLPHLFNFAKLYPDLNLHIISNKSLDLNMREADIAVQNKERVDHNLIYKYLTTKRLQIYVSPEYLIQYGEPLTFKELDQHRLIVFPPTDDGWLLRVSCARDTFRTPYMTVNSVEYLLRAAEAGLGIVMLPDDASLLKNSSLVPILKHIEAPNLDMYFVYPKVLKHVKAIRALEAYLLKAFKNKRSITDEHLE